MKRRRAGGRIDPAVAPLQGPDDVLERFFYDFGDNDHFVTDWGTALCRQETPWATLRAEGDLV